MSWALLLAKYPRSILTEERPLLILATLDRAGLATEDYLERMVGDDPSLIQQALFALKLNDLVEYGNTYLKLTEAGRELLERLSLHQRVIDDVLDTLGATGARRRNYRQALEIYRRSSFRLYQNSICTIMQWRSISAGWAARGRRDQSVLPSMHALLLRDLRNWYQHSSIGGQGLLKVDEPLRRLILLDPSHLKLTEARGNKDVTELYLRFITTDFDEQIKELLVLNGHSRWPSLLRDFHQFQASWEPDIWFEKWIGICEPIRRTGKFRSIDRYIEFLSGTLRQESRVGSRDHSHQKTQDFFKSWKPDFAQETLNDNFVPHLLSAKSLSDLSVRTHLAQNSLKQLLEHIQDSCSRLLSSGRNVVSAIFNLQSRPKMLKKKKRKKKKKKKKVRGRKI